MGSILAALSLRNSEFGQGHSICGPWGCGASTNDLVAVHAAWLALIAPPAGLLIVRRERVGVGLPIAGGIAFLTGALGIVVMAVSDWLFWIPAVDEHLHQYYLRRVGFSVANTSDLPLVQLLVVGGVMLVARIWGRRFRSPGRRSFGYASNTAN